MLSFDEKKELIVDAYCRLLDKWLAYRKVSLSDEEIELLEEDTEFQDRLLFYLIQEKESVISSLKDFMKSYNPTVGLKATVDYGKIVFPEQFSKTQEETKEQEVYNKKKEKPSEPQEKVIDATAQVLGILASSGVLQPIIGGVDETTDDKVHSSRATTKTSGLSLAHSS